MAAVANRSQIFYRDLMGMPGDQETLWSLWFENFIWWTNMVNNGEHWGTYAQHNDEKWIDLCINDYEEKPLVASHPTCWSEIRVTYRTAGEEINWSLFSRARVCFLTGISSWRKTYRLPTKSSRWTHTALHSCRCLSTSLHHFFVHHVSLLVSMSTSN